MRSELDSAYIAEPEDEDLLDDRTEVTPDRRVDQHDHQNEAYEADLAVVLPEALREEAEEEMRAIQGRDGKKVEDAEHDAHGRHGENEVLEEEMGLLLGDQGEKPDDEERDYSQDEVGERAGKGDEDVVPSRISEVVGVDRYGLAPAHQHESAGREDVDERNNERAPDVDVRDGAQGDTAEVLGGVVAAPVGDEGVGALVPGNVEEQYKEKYDLGEDLFHQLILAKSSLAKARPFS